jgi:hypothetical protein
MGWLLLCLLRWRLGRLQQLQRWLGRLRWLLQ